MPLPSTQLLMPARGALQKAFGLLAVGPVSDAVFPTGVKTTSLSSHPGAPLFALYIKNIECVSMTKQRARRGGGERAKRKGSKCVCTCAIGRNNAEATIRGGRTPGSGREEDTSAGAICTEERGLGREKCRRRWQARRCAFIPACPPPPPRRPRAARRRIGSACRV